MKTIDEMLNLALLTPDEHRQISQWIAQAETPDEILKMPAPLWRAVELEDLARLYHLSLIAGGAAILDDDEIMRTVARFDHYGPRDDV